VASFVKKMIIKKSKRLQSLIDKRHLFAARRNGSVRKRARKLIRTKLMTEYDAFIKTAKYAESAERYDDMAQCMKNVVRVAPTENGFLKIGVIERNLLSGVRERGWFKKACLACSVVY